MSELHSRLIKIQAELKAPKGQWNDFSKFNYRSAEDILEALKPLLEKYEVLQTISDEIQNIGGSDNNRFYVCATVTVRHKDEELAVTALAREPESKKGMDESQITGAASSYARKYALNGMWNIDDNKDADYRDNRPAAQQQKQPPKAQQKQKVDIGDEYLSKKEVADMQNTMIKNLGKTEGAKAWTALLKQYKVKSTSMKRSELSDYKEYLNGWAIAAKDEEEIPLPWDEFGDMVNSR